MFAILFRGETVTHFLRNNWFGKMGFSFDFGDAFLFVRTGTGAYVCVCLMLIRMCQFKIFLSSI